MAHEEKNSPDAESKQTSDESGRNTGWFLQMAFVIALLAAGAFGWLMGSKLSGGGGPGGPPRGMGGAQGPPTVIVADTPEGPAKSPGKFIGNVEAVRSVDIFAQVVGVIEEVSYEEGALVEEGQLLARIERDQYLARVQSAESALVQARADQESARADQTAAKANLVSSKADLSAAKAAFNRAEKFLNRLKKADTRSIVQADMDTAESDYEQAEARIEQSRALVSQAEAKLVQADAGLEQAIAGEKQALANKELAQIDLGFTEIKAPFTGRVGKAFANKGAYVGPAAGPLVRLVQIDPIRVVFSMSDKEYFDTVKNGSAETRERFRLEAVLPNGETYERPGVWDFSNNEMDPNTGTMAVRALYDNPDGLLAAKTFVTVYLKDTTAPKAPTVPKKAILRDLQGTYVLVVGDDGTVEQRRLQLGDSLGDRQAVASGLSVGETIIVEGLRKATPGNKVNPVRDGVDEGGSS